MDHDALDRREKLLQLREELLAVEQDRLAGRLHAGGAGDLSGEDHGRDVKIFLFPGGQMCYTGPCMQN